MQVGPKGLILDVGQASPKSRSPGEGRRVAAFGVSAKQGRIVLRPYNEVLRQYKKDQLNPGGEFTDF